MIRGYEGQEGVTPVTTILFTVDAILRDGNAAFVDGVVCESAIQVGDTFTCLRGPARVRDAVTARWLAGDPGGKDAIKLRIESIESYRHFWKAMSPGMTARIGLSGDGIDLLRKHVVLVGVLTRAEVAVDQMVPSDGGRGGA